MTATHRAYFGEGEHDFRLSPPLIEELERVLNAGIGTIVMRFMQGHFALRDLVEIIRLALIGGGMPDNQAQLLAGTYVAAQPLVASQILAADILGALWNGAEPTIDPLQHAAATGDLSAAIST